MITDRYCYEFERFAKELREDDDKHFSPFRFAGALNLEFKELAQLAHVGEESLRANPNGGQVQDYLRNAVRVLGVATEYAGDDLQRAIFWFRNGRIQMLDNKTAEVLVSEGRTDQVIRYIDSLNSGSG